MSAMRIRWWGALACLLAWVVQAQPVAVRDLRIWTAPDNTRVVLELGGTVEHRLFTLAHPDRVVLDISDAVLKARLQRLDLPRGPVRAVRSGVRHHHDLRLVFDLDHHLRPRSFLLKPSADHGYRLVLDLASAHQGSAPVKRAREMLPKALRPVVVAVDAGHGGQDPGAHGRLGTREKDVTLSIARRLARLIDQDPAMHAVLVRNGDYFLPLRTRMRKARRLHADLFISIHADSFRDARARGASVYILSRRGASSEMARMLAARENAADRVGGVPLGDKDPVLKRVLVDLSQGAVIEESLHVAQALLYQLRRIGPVHRRQVQQAGFVVLKSPDIPSVLVETAFISNPREERLLKDGHHQQALARALYRGIRRYFRDNPPMGTLFASRRHRIRPGDTLLAIAHHYDVSLQALRKANDLHGDRLQVGQVLRIPGDG